MRTIWVVVLVVIAVIAGSGIGWLGGFFGTVFSRVYTDLEIGCAVLQTAETRGYLSKEQRSQLVALVLPPFKGSPGTTERGREFGAWQLDSWRNRLNCNQS